MTDRDNAFMNEANLYTTRVTLAPPKSRGLAASQAAVLVNKNNYYIDKEEEELIKFKMLKMAFPTPCVGPFFGSRGEDSNPPSLRSDGWIFAYIFFNNT